MLGGVDANAAVPGRAVSDDQIVRLGQLVASGTHVEIYQHGVTIEPSFLKVMESAYDEVQKLTGLKLDTATLGATIRVYVSASVGVSHLWRGYQHPSDPRAVIFLNPRVYRKALNGKNATHIHEFTHLFTWDFKSHTLREGLADYVARTILPGAAVGPNPAGESLPSQVPAEVLEHLGTTKPPPDWVSNDPVRRSAYYFASHRFVKYLVDLKGMETFMKLYNSQNPETDIIGLYGRTREDVIRSALK